VILDVQIEGSTGTPYAVSLSREGDRLTTSCTCPAGDKGIHCKHRLALFAGDLTRVCGDTKTNLAQEIATILAGTGVEAALRALNAAEVDAKVAADRLRQAKKALDRAMHQ
jgi:uncharacterized Zn finger protein